MLSWLHYTHSLTHSLTRKARSFRFVFASFKLLDSLLINHTNAHYYHPLTQEAIHTPYTNYHCPSPSYHSLTHSLTRKLARSLVRSFRSFVNKNKKHKKKYSLIKTKNIKRKQTSSLDRNSLDANTLPKSRGTKQAKQKHTYLRSYYFT